MLHKRHYTIDQARAVMEWVAERVGWAREANARLVALGDRATEGVAALAEGSGGSYPGRAVARPLVELSHVIGELAAVDIVLRDFDRGLVDFPAIRDGEEVYLCWLVDDEDEIGFWHAPEAGFAGRQPL
jgi:Uncharacterized conserved protein (DUF2203)